MNLILLEPDAEVSPGIFEVGERYAFHARQVWKSRPGDRVRVGLVGGNRGTARVVALERDWLRLEIERLDEAPPPPLGVDLAVALVRPPMLRRVLQQAAAMGVKRIHVFDAARVEKSFWSSRELAPEVVRRQLLLGLEQAGDTQLPEVSVHRRFSDFAAEARPPVAIADPGGEELGAGPRPRLAVVGPEGGLRMEEIERLHAAGGRTVTLGPRILRVDTACVVLLSRIAERFGPGGSGLGLTEPSARGKAA